MNSTLKILLVPVFATAIAAAGFGAALASEVTGTVGTQSYADGGLIASVSEPSQATTTEQAAGSTARTGGRSSASRLYRTSGGSVAPAQGSSPADMITIVDDSALASASNLGTGGGYDPELESLLSQQSDEGGTEVGYLSPGDAIAFNSAQNVVPAALTAAASESGVSGPRIWTAVILGLALIGLAGYAANALIAYRRENDL